MFDAAKVDVGLEHNGHRKGCRQGTSRLKSCEKSIYLEDREVRSIHRYLGMSRQALDMLC